MQIKLVATPEGAQEWMAIELHGSISPHEGSLDGKTLGTICWGDRNNVYMIIGNQTLEGKLRELKVEKSKSQISKIDRPLLVIRKSDEDRLDGKKNATVNAVVRKKLIFKIRPRPLVISAVA